VISDGHGGTATANEIITVTPVPDLTPILRLLPNVTHGVTNFSVIVDVTEVNRVNTESLITVRITKDPRWGFDWAANKDLTQIGTIPVNNAIWTYYSGDANYHVFTTSTIIVADVSKNGVLTFGFTATFNPGSGEGIATITSHIQEYSGGENRINNNVDAEKLYYFSK
jgi:hypothetical protein